MKRLSHPQRREISLLATNSLPEQDRPEVERHLDACPVCRDYYREIKTLTAPLANWEEHFAGIEPTQVMQARWSAAVRASATEAARHEPFAKNVLRNIWREIIWPSRRAWAGMAAIWLALLAVNARLSDHPAQMAGFHSSSPSEIMLSWEEQTRVLAELTQPAVLHSAPANPPPAPANPLRPRSARKQEIQIV